MPSTKILPESPKEIDLSKVQWQFWQKSYSYSFGNDYICLFSCDTKAVDKYGTPINSLGCMDIIYKAFGSFSLYKTFKMSNSKYGIDKTSPLKTIDISSDTQGLGLDEFKQLGIYESLNQYLLSLNTNINN